MIWGGSGASGLSDGGRLIWVIEWVCGRGCDRIEFEKGVWLDEHDGNLVGQ